jgi:hypothetical protein
VSHLNGSPHWAAHDSGIFFRRTRRATDILVNTVHMKLLFVWLVATSALSSQVIEGKVANSVTGAPIGGVAVTIQSADRTAYQTTTDLGGTFRIDDVKAGHYAANFSKSEFLELEANSPARRPFNVVSGSDRIRLDIKLTPLGKILGRVLDSNGDPLANAEVLLDSSRFGRSLSTDKNGNFAFQVAPGRYTLLAKPPSSLKPPETGENEHVGWVPTYYPGVLDARAAVRIVLNAGAELFGNDIKLKATSMRRVRGMVRDLQGDPAPRVGVRTARTDDTLSDDIETVSGEDGTFEFPCLYEGEWSIFAEKESNGIKLKASAGAMIGDRDLDNLELRMTAPYSVHGSISFDGAGKLPGKINVYLKPSIIAGSQGVSQAIVGQDGAFKIDNVYPGSYEVIALLPGTSYFLSTIKLGDRDILGRYLEFYPGSLPIRIAFESKGGGVRGKVDECGSATVVLAPQDRTLQEPQFVQTAKCGDSGRFEISHLRPGEYYAFAFDTWDGPLDLLANLDQNVTKAASVHVNQGEVATIDLRITPRDP